MDCRGEKDAWLFAGLDTGDWVAVLERLARDRSR
jgi:hypothetical protein